MRGWQAIILYAILLHTGWWVSYLMGLDHAAQWHLFMEWGGMAIWANAMAIGAVCSLFSLCRWYCKDRYTLRNWLMIPQQIILMVGAISVLYSIIAGYTGPVGKVFSTAALAKISVPPILTWLMHTWAMVRLWK